MGQEGKKMNKVLVWLRRDLRLTDHHALHAACKQGNQVYLVFIFDSEILKHLKNPSERRVQFIFECLTDLQKELDQFKQKLIIRFGNPVNEIADLVTKHHFDAVFTNRDYEPYAVARDKNVANALLKLNCQFKSFKDSVIFEQDEVRSGKGDLYRVFTPYKNQWLKLYTEQNRQFENYPVNSEKIYSVSSEKSINEVNWMNIIKFTPTENLIVGGRSEGLKLLKKFQSKIDQYHINRDFPALAGTSNLSPHIRFGTLSIRELASLAYNQNTSGSQVWLSELIWRDFYQMILSSNPQVIQQSFKPDYDKIIWPGKKEDFESWKQGQTGFPLIDASMRYFSQTGLMHNRLRMVVASFLCKILLVDWRLGEQYFAETLLDFDLAANNGGWQWSSSSGCDAQPYFRIFNPYTQSEKFDTEAIFIKQHLPELKHVPKKYIHAPHRLDMLQQNEYQVRLGIDYPFPIVDYAQNREKCLALFKQYLS